MAKKLYKSNTDKVFAGVLGGIGEYFEIDPTILRLAYILVSILTGIFPAIIGYVIAAIVVPKKPLVYHMPASDYKEKKEEASKTEPGKTEPKKPEKNKEENHTETESLDL